jgi:hypothetical protein
LVVAALLNNISAFRLSTGRKPMRATYVPGADVFIQREITDADGDGVEDNVNYSPEELDRFYRPKVFKSADDMHNTLNDEMPGHGRKFEHPEPEGHWGEFTEEPHYMEDAEAAPAEEEEL